MQVNRHDAKTHRSRYVDQAMGDEDVVIARAARPRGRLVPVREEGRPRRLGCLSASTQVEADLKAAFAADIAAMFEEVAHKSAQP